MSYPTVILSDNPIRYYRLGKSSGAIIDDAGLNSLNGTQNGTITSGRVGALAGVTVPLKAGQWIKPTQLRPPGNGSISDRRRAW